MFTSKILKGLITAAVILSYISCSEKVKALQKPDLQSFQIIPNEITLTVAKDNAPADGSSNNQLLFRTTHPLASRPTSVKLSIKPMGKFSNGDTVFTAAVDINGEATAFIVSRLSGPVIVSATFGDVSKQVASIFTIAYPDYILVEADSVYLDAKAGSQTRIKAVLVRNTGTPNSGLRVSFTDSTSTTVHPGIFLNTTASNDSGIAYAQYWIQNFNYHDFVSINAQVDVPATPPVTGTNRILIR